MRSLAVIVLTSVLGLAQVQLSKVGDRFVYHRPDHDQAFNQRGIGHPVKGVKPVLWYVYDPYIRKFCKEMGVDPVFAKAIIWQESRFQWRATSKKNARGLMQLMDRTAASLGGAKSPLGTYDPIENIRLGVDYVSRLQTRYQGNLIKVAAAYNAGEGNVDRYSGVPPFRETRAYVIAVLTMWDCLNKGKLL